MISLKQYLDFWNSCKITNDVNKRNELFLIFSKTKQNSALYKEVALASQVPWFLIAAIHFRESDQDFSKNLCNGDPLTGRTIHEPKGHPLEGAPPFSWKEAAIDALSLEWKPESWNISTVLEFCEKYNGLGYQYHNVMTPYLWDYTDLYKSGLYTEDGKFNPNLIENRPGIVAMLKTFESYGIKLNF